MTINCPGQKDVFCLRQIWQEAFGDSDAFLDGFFAAGFSPERCLCVFHEDRPVSVAYWFDCLWEEKKLAYVYAVATKQQWRGMGLSTALLRALHGRLAASGYHGVILVPGEAALVDFYDPMGYKSCCPMDTVTVKAAPGKDRPERITAPDYSRHRRRLLPAGGVVQEGAAVAYLETFAQLYTCRDALFSFTREKSTLYFQEYLGDPAHLPGIIGALGGKKGVVRLPGTGLGAMYLALEEDPALPSYFGLSLG